MVVAWLGASFTGPTEAHRHTSAPAHQRAWPLNRGGRAPLVAAPSGSGETLAAFLAAIDDLVRSAMEHGGARPDPISDKIEARFTSARSELPALPF